MSLKAKTTRTENDLVKFANDNNIPLASLDHTVNSSGMFTVFHKNADAALGTLVFGTDTTTGAAPGTSYGSAFSDEQLNVANVSKVALYIYVTATNASALDVFPRLSRLAEPTIATETDWHRPLDSAGAYISGTVGSSIMGTSNAQVVVEIDVSAANWVSFSFSGNAAHRITIYAEAVA